MGRNNNYFSGRNGWGQSSYRYEGPRLPNLNIPIGTKCKIKTSDHNITATVIRIGREQYELRMPDLTTNWFYPHEIEPIIN